MPTVAASTGPRKPDLRAYLTSLIGPLGGLAGGFNLGGGGARPQAPEDVMLGRHPLPEGTGINAGLPQRNPVLSQTPVDPTQPLPPPPPDPVLDAGPTLEQLESAPVAPEAVGGVPLPVPPPEPTPPPERAPRPQAAAPAPMVASAIANRRQRPAPAPSSIGNQRPGTGDRVMGAPRVNSLLQYLPKQRPAAPRPAWHGWMQR